MSPIKPENRKHYGKDWDRLSLLLREKAGWRCELCQTPNGDLHSITGGEVVLTIHHINAIPEDNRKCNLIALCQRCHNRLDQPFRRKKERGGRLLEKEASDE